MQGIGCGGCGCKGQTRGLAAAWRAAAHLKQEVAKVLASVKCRLRKLRGVAGCCGIRHHNQRLTRQAQHRMGGRQAVVLR